MKKGGPGRLKSVGRDLRRKLLYYRAVAAHERTPRLSKILLGLAIGYALLPFDLIPDFLPVVGHLDDAVIVPSLVYLAIKRVPKDVLDECRKVSHGDAV